MGSMSLEPSKAMRSIAPMGGEATSGIVEAFDPHHSELNGVVSTKEVRVERIKTLTRAITFVLLAAFGTWAIYSGLAMATGDQAHIGVGVFCLLGAVLLYRAWFRGPAIIGSKGSDHPNKLMPWPRTAP
jgi:hypothetical protein